jgi:uncharacterized protein (TIGR03437 family)
MRPRNVLVLGFGLLAISFLAQAQTTPVTCTAATLTGVRSLVLNGRDATQTAVLSKTYEGVGTATFDGVGSVTFNLTTNTNQAQGVAQKLSGTYTLPSNCLGTLNITTGDTASFTLIPFNLGKNFTITGQDASYSFTGSGADQPAACLTSTLSGVYAFSGNGFTLALANIGGTNSISGLLQFDGAGAITGNWSVATNGASTSDTITGHYTVSSSCTASATVTDPNGTAYTMAFTVTSVDGANFSLITSSPQNLFTGTGHSAFTNPGLAVANAAGVVGGTPPGSLFTIYGSGLSTGQAQPTNVPLPTTLASATVTVNGESAPLTYVDKTQINAQMPLDIQPGVAIVVVKNGTTLSNSVAVTVPGSAVPGIFIYGANHAVAQNFPSYSLNSPSAPAKVGDSIIVYLTGGGPVQNGTSLVTGHATPNAAFPVTGAYSATLAGVTATVNFIGLTPAFVGLYQANVVIPKVAAGERNLVITIAGTASNAALVSVN